MSSATATEGSTLTRSDGGEEARARVRTYALTGLLESGRPLGSPTRAVLAGVDEVVLGRGARRESGVVEEAGVRRRVVRIPDGRMSSVHARLRRELGRWVVEDAGSKNGVLVNGVYQQRALLEPGDVLELGHTFLLFGEGDGEAEPYRSLAGEALGTYHPELGRGLHALVEVARASVPVVLQGESGTGKEVVARALHQASGRSGAFVPVNCGALPATLVESELFGHRKGAFTGATEDRPGLVRSASGGTLFLDEVGDLPLPLQAAFLRVLQEGEVLPVGAAQPVRVDFRVVAATHRDLGALVRREQFRADLFARLSGFTLPLPALRERRADLGLLLATLVRRHAAEPHAVSFSPPAARALLLYPWPLNVRELEKALSVALVLAQSGRVELEHLPAAVRAGAAAPPPPPRALPPDGAGEQRRGELEALLREHHGNVSAIARQMGVARMQVQRWLKRYGLEATLFR